MRYFIFLTFRSRFLLLRIILSIFVPYFYRELFWKVLNHILLTLRTPPWDTMGKCQSDIEGTSWDTVGRGGTLWDTLGGLNSRIIATSNGDTEAM